MRGYAEYPAYKQVDLGWISNLPAHWELERAKYVFKRVQREVREQDGIVTAFRDGQVTLRSNRRLDGFTNALKEIGYQGVRVGDLLVHAMDGFAGAIGISDSEGKCSPVCSVCIPANPGSIHMNYYGYLVRQLAVTDFITSLAKGIRERSTEFRYSEFSSLDLALPPLIEQQKIANFLDHETAKIDTLIEKQQQLIKLLKEKRQAVISHAVTKGLNPNAPMKDSGVEWLGEVPAEWTLMKLRFVLKESPKNGYSPPVDGGGDVPTFSIAAVQNGQVLIDENLKYATATQDKASAARVYKGDLLLLRGNGNIHLVAKAGIVLSDPPKGCIYPDLLIRLRVNGLVSSEYLMSILSAAPVRAQIETFSKTSAGIWKISGSCLSDVEIIVPPLDMQTAITRYIQDTAGKIELLLKKSGDAILILKERRTALISAAVTGKIDVRNWQAPESTSTPSMDR